MIKNFEDIIKKEQDSILDYFNTTNRISQNPNNYDTIKQRPADKRLRRTEINSKIHQ